MDVVRTLPPLFSLLLCRPTPSSTFARRLSLRYKDFILWLGFWCSWHTWHTSCHASAHWRHSWCSSTLHAPQYQTEHHNTTPTFSFCSHTV